MTIRWRHAPIVLLGLESLAWFVGAFIESGDRQAMIGVDPAEASQQARIVAELSIVGALNVLVTILFVFRRSAVGWWVVLGFQAAVFLFALAQAMASDDGLGWSFICGLALLATGWLVAIRLSETRSEMKLKLNSKPR